MTKEFKRVVAEAKNQGWLVRKIKKGLQLMAPDGATMVTIHKSPSDRRALNNTIAQMRRFGFRWSPE